MRVKISVIDGVEGLCLGINERRVAGPKPWGGGHVIKEWDVEIAEIIHALTDVFDPIARPVQSVLEETEILKGWLENIHK